MATWNREKFDKDNQALYYYHGDYIVVYDTFLNIFKNDESGRRPINFDKVYRNEGNKIEVTIQKGSITFDKDDINLRVYYKIEDDAGIEKRVQTWSLNKFLNFVKENNLL